MIKFILVALAVAFLAAGAPVVRDAIRFQVLMYRQPGSYCPAIWPVWRGTVEDAADLEFAMKGASHENH